MTEPPSSIEYETALACFQAAAELFKQGQVVNGPRIKAIVGRGSHSTTKKYADLWKMLENGEDAEISGDARAAYDAVKDGNENKTTFALPPPDELKDLVCHIWELVQSWIATECRETWQEAGDQLEAMQAHVINAQALRDKAKAELAQYESARTKLVAQNHGLQQSISKLSGQLEVVESQRKKLTEQNAVLGQTVSEQSNQLVRFTVEVEKYQEQLAESKQREQKLRKKIISAEQALENMRGTKEKLREQVVKLEQIESSLGSQLEQERVRIGLLEKKIEQQIATITTLNGEARAAEERVKHLSN
ncbi:MAG: hypothetical protein AAF959_00630 [Cyanobacteria bacterium P01_D01_bin.56]